MNDPVTSPGVVSASVVMRGGDRADSDPALGPPAPGRAEIALAAVVRSGSASHPGPALASALASLSADLGGGTADDSASLGVSCLAEDFPSCLTLLAEAATEPCLVIGGDDGPATAAADRAVADVVAAAADGVSRAKEDALGQAETELARLVFGPTHPEARRASAASVRAFDRAALARHVRRWHRPDVALVAVGGDLGALPVTMTPAVAAASSSTPWPGKGAGEAHAAALVDASGLGAWRPAAGEPTLPPTLPALPSLPLPSSSFSSSSSASRATALGPHAGRPPPTAPPVVLVDLGPSGGRGAAVAVAALAPSAADRDAPALSVANEVVGGGDGYLFDRLRSRRGLAYYCVMGQGGTAPARHAPLGLVPPCRAEPPRGRRGFCPGRAGGGPRAGRGARAHGFGSVLPR